MKEVADIDTLTMEEVEKEIERTKSLLRNYATSLITLKEQRDRNNTSKWYERSPGLFKELLNILTDTMEEDLLPHKETKKVRVGNEEDKQENSSNSDGNYEIEEHTENEIELSDNELKENMNHSREENEPEICATLEEEEKEEELEIKEDENGLIDDELDEHIMNDGEDDVAISEGTEEESDANDDIQFQVVCVSSDNPVQSENEMVKTHKDTDDRLHESEKMNTETASYKNFELFAIDDSPRKTGPTGMDPELASSLDPAVKTEFSQNMSVILKNYRRKLGKEEWNFKKRRKSREST